MMRKKPRNSRHATTLGEAVELNLETAASNRRPIKVMADLMGVETKTFYRWMSENSMPLNLVRQFEEFCGAHHVSEYLCVADGRRIVIDIPTGRRPSVAAVAVLCRYYQSGDEQAEALSALTHAMMQAAYHRANVAKDHAPELPFDQTEAE
jgi:hypothetical protein